MFQQFRDKSILWNKHDSTVSGKTFQVCSTGMSKWTRPIAQSDGGGIPVNGPQSYSCTQMHEGAAQGLHRFMEGG